MPLYEFRCPTCVREFESLVRPSEPARCPECGSESLERLVSAAATRTVSGNLPVACPPPETGPCGPGCCRLPG